MDQSNSGDQNVNSGSSGFAVAERLLTDLRQAVSRFQEQPSPDTFTGILTALRAFGSRGSELWEQAVTYARQNPMQVAVFAGIGALAVKGILDTPRQSERLEDSSIH